MAKLRITYRKSSIGFSKDQKATVRSLGLRKLNSTVIQEDTPSIRGMIFKVQHLVSVEEVGDDVQAEQKQVARTTIVRPREAHAESVRPSAAAGSATQTNVEAGAAASPAHADE